MRCRFMGLPNDPTSNWLSRSGSPSRMIGNDRKDYDLYEQDGEFVLSIEMPGFEREDIDVHWHEARLTVAAESEDDRRERTRSYRRTFRMPKRIDEDSIRARYNKGILDVYLPTIEASPKGKEIPIES